MNILDQIIASKHEEVARRKREMPVAELERSPFFESAVRSMCQSLLEKAPTAIIAEFKRRSPSKGDIFNAAEVIPVVKSYEQAGCAGISILTDEKYFGGSLDDLITARPHVNVPLLRKDFMIDTYQIIEARSAGADLILLIAEVLTKEQVYTLASFAKSLDLEVLLEMHSGLQIPKINEHIDIVGINNRDLKTFAVDVDASIRLLDQLPGEYLRISESGLSASTTVH
ncbi:MAG: indole-3-glycerol-phosphate synthase, partial [Saprospiraceae bacterium]|nr:indole-3-glycerol-phosphate synthase [Saprospiraceae bacterium]